MIEGFSIKKMAFKSKTLLLLVSGILAIFTIRTLLAAQFAVPRLFDLFDALVLAGSAVVLWRGYASLTATDWLAAAGLGCVVGVGLLFATLFTPYPFFGIIKSHTGLAMVRGTAAFLACLGGLTVMRQGGPVIFQGANRKAGRAGRDLLFGLLLGMPLAALNVFALQFTQGQSISWQNPGAAMLDALQPAVLEEVLYRFALWGLLWLLLRKSTPDQAVWLSGGLALLIHNFAHYDDLFLQSPLAAVGMGLVVMLIWGLPPTLLARYRGLEAAIAFHWIQDAARFLAGF